MDIGGWLRGLGLEQYGAAFREHEIDAEVLPTLTAEDLRELGVAAIGHRRKLLTAIALLSEPPSSTIERAANSRCPSAKRLRKRGPSADTSP
jgi:SAM domain (Sterile alpha motif)